MDVKVVTLDDGERIDLGGGSWSHHLLNTRTVSSEKAMLGISTFTPGTDTPQKVHEEEELCYVIRGKGEITVGERTVPFHAPAAIYIPPGVAHGVRNNGDQDVLMVYVFSYPEYPPTREPG
jgi:quercetin dioxygenase-like cupin family protein